MSCFNWNYIIRNKRTKQIYLVNKNYWEEAQKPKIFMADQGDPKDFFKVPCQKCDGCRLKNAIEWGIRCQKEMIKHTTNWFITLTYNDENLPTKADDENQWRATLKYRDIQLFLKKLRKWLEPEKIKFFGSAEYGSKTGRPHYHLTIFGGEKINENLQNERNIKIEKIWGKGMINIKKANILTTEYIARYTTKKSYKTKKYMGMEKEKLYTSKKIGQEWFKENKNQIIERDEINAAITGGKMAKTLIPRTWRNWLDEETNKKITENRINQARKMRKRLKEDGINIEEKEINEAIRTKEKIKLLNQKRKL